MEYIKEYKRWLESPFVDDDTKEELKKLSPEEIKECFYTDLEFGTGGLRGIMAAGTNRMNIYTVRKATQALAGDILSCGSGNAQRGVVIAYDSRNNSKLFALECASVLGTNGIKCYMFDSLRPTPELSFAVRYLNCYRGIVITASHNPKEYNGYKVYGEDGGQIPPDISDKISRLIKDTDIFDDVKITLDTDTIIIGEDVDKAYIESIKKESLGTKIPDDFSVVYTPLHGAGNLPVRRILSEIGVKNLYVVASQEKPDGNFPTVKSPNPENKEAFDLAIEEAGKIGADLIIGTDPDSDRIGVVVKDSNGNYRVLNGNQTGVLLAEYILSKTKEKGMAKNPKIVKTIVTTEMVRDIAKEYGVETVDVLTGFKYIGDKIKEFEQTDDHFLFGLEESYGYLKGTYARDKDAVVSSMLICELAAQCKANGISLYEKLESLYKKHGFYSEKLLNYNFEGISGTEKMQSIMKHFRQLKPLTNELKRIDYLTGVNNLPKSNVVKLVMTDGWIAGRPSGTEPKIKFYIGVVSDSKEKCEQKLLRFTELINNIVKKEETK